MVEQIHLHDCFLHIHRLHNETLRLDDRILLAFLMQNRHRPRLHGIRLEPAAAEPLLQLRLLLADLALQLLHHQINGRIHVHRCLFAAQQHIAPHRHSNLHNMPALRHGQENRDLFHFFKILQDFSNPFLHIFPKRRSNLNVLSAYSECCHMTHPLSFVPVLILTYILHHAQNPCFPQKKITKIFLRKKTPGSAEEPGNHAMMFS